MPNPRLAQATAAIYPHDTFVWQRSEYYGGSAGFGLFISTDFKSWTRVTNMRKPFYDEKVKFPTSIRHGNIVSVIRRELKKLKAFVIK